MKYVLIALLCWPLWAGAQNHTISFNYNGGVEEWEVIYTQHDTVNGSWIAVYAEDTTQMAFKRSYVRTKPNGLYKAWYPNGKVREFGVYGYGSLHGDWVEYDQEGNVLIRGKYKEGKKNGFWAYRTKNCFGKYLRDQKHGRWKCFDKEGNKTITLYNKGEEVWVR